MRQKNLFFLISIKRPRASLRSGGAALTQGGCANMRCVVWCGVVVWCVVWCGVVCGVWCGVVWCVVCGVVCGGGNH